MADEGYFYVPDSCKSGAQLYLILSLYSLYGVRELQKPLH